MTQQPPDSLVFQVDLWSARGEFPRNLAEVATRQKEIQYSGRTRAFTDYFKHVTKLRKSFYLYYRFFLRRLEAFYTKLRGANLPSKQFLYLASFRKLRLINFWFSIRKLRVNNYWYEYENYL